MARAKLLGLFREGDIVGGDRLAHMRGAVADHDHQPRRRQRACRIEDVRQHGPPCNRVQYLGQIGNHSLAHAGGENDDIHKETPK
ncbi:hypothetical protein Tamer19_11520 [Cupriavidus sp. TA19]|nr:hypothetical protein Tamer19_11520 [Cupriavidus sp. TA19]